MLNSTDRAPKTGLILSGGGARGAYEAGVIKYIREQLPARIRSHARFEIICGTSVGAVNSCFLAALSHIPESQGEALAQMWRSLRIDGIYEIGWRELVNLPKFILGSRGRGELDEIIGSSRLGGLFNTSPLEDLVRRHIRWKNVQVNLESGDVQALALTATHVSSGMTHIFLQRAKSSQPLLWSTDPQMQPFEVELGPAHALASAAIPWIFPAVELEGEVYCDGGIKLNTPISPALRLGADRLLVINLRTEERIRAEKRRAQMDRYPSALFLLGKILNALMLDKTDYDLERLERFNNLADLGNEEFRDNITALRGSPYRHIDTLVIRPSEDLGVLAARRLRMGGLAERVGGVIGRVLSRIVESTDQQGSDFLSYLLFDVEYANDLIELGMHDADASRQKIIDFFN
ncbi:MAG: patatin-like phospholipase family protein [Myxococcota bacterium]